MRGYWKWNQQTDELTCSSSYDASLKSNPGVASDYVKTLFGMIHVSTVFLVLDHSFGVGCDPILFETMMFGWPLEEYQERYRTAAEARNGHQHALKLARQARYRIDWWIRQWWRS